VKGRADNRRVVDVVMAAWYYIDQRYSPHVSGALVDLGVTHFAKTPAEREKLQALASISGFAADDVDDPEQIKQARKQLEKELMDQGGFRAWLAGAWVVASVRAPWSFFVALAMFASMPVLLALEAVRLLR